MRFTRAYPEPDPPILPFWRVFLSLNLLQGIVVLYLYLASKSEVGLLLGLSGARLIIVAGILVILIANLWFLAETWIKPKSSEQRVHKAVQWIAHPPRLGILTLLSALTLCLGIYACTLVPEARDSFTTTLLDRLLPLIVWLIGICTLILLSLYGIRVRYFGLKLKRIPKVVLLLLLYFGAVLLGWIWVTGSIFPLASARVGWNPPGVPVIEGQVLIALVVGTAIMLLIHRLKNSPRTSAWFQTAGLKRLDLFTAIALWLIAVIFWQSTPLTASWFVTEKLPPNFENYPYSDARNYDEVAQSALIGENFRFFGIQDIRRPLHAAYLTVLHLLVGQQYDRVIFLQVLVLALFPVFIFLITKNLSNRAAAVCAALLIIFREANSIWLASEITTSHVKLIMVDLFTATIVVFFGFWAFRWLKQREAGSLSAFVAGGILGLAMLVRLETAVLALSPAVISAFNLIPKRRLGLWIKQLALFGLSILLVISPWLYRNFRSTGSIFAGSLSFPYMIILQRFGPIDQTAPAQPTQVSPQSSPTAPPLNPTPFASPAVPAAVAPPTSTPSYDSRLAAAAGKSLSNTFGNPVEFASLFAAHYLNSQIQMLLGFPAAFRVVEGSLASIGHRNPAVFWADCCSLSEYVRNLPFWRKWDGRFPRQSALPLLATVLFLIIGLHRSWSRHRWTGLMPALAASIYIGFYAVLRNSGGRYILPVAWVAFLYFSIGLMDVAAFAIRLVKPTLSAAFSDQDVEPEQQPTAKLSLLHLPVFYFSALTLFAVGCAIPIIKFEHPTVFYKRPVPGYVI